MKYEFRTIDVDEVKVRARAGSHRDNCLKECVILAFSEGRVVCLIHNDKEYIVNPDGILDVLLKDGQNAGI